MMGRKRQQVVVPAASEFSFYRTTPKGKAAGAADCVRQRSHYMADVLEMCGRGMWGRELRQFMPPASLEVSISCLLELGLIECVDARAPGP